MPGVLVNLWPYSAVEIDFDIDLRELQGQERLDTLCGFLAAIGRRLGKPVLMVPGAHDLTFACVWGERTLRRWAAYKLYSENGLDDQARRLLALRATEGNLYQLFGWVSDLSINKIRLML
ncbi:hypothetical protein [Micromonospora zamorensis]|uniref:hypothetical protein n=1 Tax=Micromonospora zamorensis TaxID=709883 RepID=UPI00399C28EF